MDWFSMSLVMVQLTLMICAAAVILLPRVHSAAVAWAGGLCMALLFISFRFQVAYLLPSTEIQFLWLVLTEQIFYIACLVWVLNRRTVFASLLGKTFRFCGACFWMLLLVLPAWLYMAAQIVLLPAGNFDSMKYNLARVMFIQQEGQIPPDVYTNIQQRIQPLGHDIIYMMFLRYHSDAGVGLICFLEYLAIGAMVFALARVWFDRTASVTAALVWYTLPTVVYQATSTKNDLLPALTALLACWIAVQVWRKPSWTLWVVLAYVLAFGVSAKTTFAAFVIPFALLGGGMTLWKRRRDLLPAVNRRTLMGIGCAMLPLLVVSQVWLFVSNYGTYGGVFGPQSYIGIYQNQDGLVGGMANAVRYGIQLLHGTELMNVVSAVGDGPSITERIQVFYDESVKPWVGERGTSTEVQFFWDSRDDLSWFGPVGCTLIPVALLFGMMRGPMGLRLVLLSALGYSAMVCLQVVWMPYNGRFFSLAMALVCVAVAALLPPVRFRWVGVAFIAAVTTPFLYYACIFNANKPLVTEERLVEELLPLWYEEGHPTRTAIARSRRMRTPPSDEQLWQWAWEEMEARTIWAQTRNGSERLYYANVHFGDRRVQQFINTVASGADVAVIAGSGDSWIFPYMLHRHDVTMIPVSQENIEDGVLTLPEGVHVDYVLCIQIQATSVAGYPDAVILHQSTWPAIPGTLIRLRETPVAPG